MEGSVCYKPRCRDNSFRISDLNQCDCPSQNNACVTRKRNRKTDGSLGSQFRESNFTKADYSCRSAVVKNKWHFYCGSRRDRVRNYWPRPEIANNSLVVSCSQHGVSRWFGSNLNKNQNFTSLAHLLKISENINYKKFFILYFRANETIFHMGV